MHIFFICLPISYCRFIYDVFLGGFFYVFWGVLWHFWVNLWTDGHFFGEIERCDSRGN